MQLDTRFKLHPKRIVILKHLVTNHFILKIPILLFFIRGGLGLWNDFLLSLWIEEEIEFFNWVNIYFNVLNVKIEDLMQ